MISTNTKRSDHLLESISPYDGIAVVTHDIPDPDAIAAGWALSRLFEKRLGKTVKLIGSGPIVRAENKHMVKLLHPPLLLLDHFFLQDHAIVLVDCVPTAANHLLNGSGMRADAVIDHHIHDNHEYEALYRDIRPAVAATASIACGYLIEQNVEPSLDLATALLYAIRTETRGEQVGLSATDQQVISWLSDRADHVKIAEIENAPLPRNYYVDLVLAIENTFLYEDVAICFLPHAAGAELVGEIADFLIRCDELSSVLCGALVRDALIVSARTTRGGGNAAALLQRCLESVGHCGGHDHRAGGKISLTDNGVILVTDLQSLLKERWLQACHVDSRQGRTWSGEQKFWTVRQREQEVLQ